MFTHLPYELLLIVFEYLITSGDKSPEYYAVQACRLQSVCSRTFKEEPLVAFFNKYWRSVLLSIVVGNVDEYESIESELKSYKRAYCILHAACMANKQAKLQRSKSNHESLHLVVVGNGGVGKSALVIQYTQNFFMHAYDPTIEDSYRKMVSFRDAVVQLEILDTAGAEEFSALQESYMRVAEGVLFVCCTVEPIQQLDSRMAQLVKQVSHLPQTTPIIIALNKVDLDPSDWKVTEQDVRNLMQNHGLGKSPLVKVSAATREGVDELFEDVARRIRYRFGLATLKRMLEVDKDVIQEAVVGFSSTPTSREKKCMVM